MAITLSITSDELAPEDLQDLSRDVNRSLVREAGLQAAPVERPAGPGARGDPVTAGNILINLATHSAAVVVGHVVVDVMRFFERPA